MTVESETKEYIENRLYQRAIEEGIPIFSAMLDKKRFYQIFTGDPFAIPPEDLERPIEPLFG